MNYAQGCPQLKIRVWNAADSSDATGSGDDAPDYYVMKFHDARYNKRV